jgi:hypothetical protein
VDITGLDSNRPSHKLNNVAEQFNAALEIQSTLRASGAFHNRPNESVVIPRGHWSASGSANKRGQDKSTFSYYDIRILTRNTARGADR